MGVFSWARYPCDVQACAVALGWIPLCNVLDFVFLWVSSTKYSRKIARPLRTRPRSIVTAATPASQEVFSMRQHSICSRALSLSLSHTHTHTCRICLCFVLDKIQVVQREGRRAIEREIENEPPRTQASMYERSLSKTSWLCQASPMKQHSRAIPLPLYEALGRLGQDEPASG